MEPSYPERTTAIIPMGSKMPGITIFQAKSILTMNSNCLRATHVAVRDGRILGVGSLSDLEPWGDYSLDDRFAEKVLMPGFVEGHAHSMEGTFWRFTYCGYFDRMDPKLDFVQKIARVQVQ